MFNQLNIRRVFIFGFGVAFLVLIAIGVYFVKSKKIEGERRIIEYSLEGKTYRLLLADEPEEWERGLMYVRQAKRFDGMLFVFPDKKFRQFWNKNTFVDLDIYWIAKDKVVGKSFLPSIERSGRIVIVSSPTPVDKVVELIQE